MTAPSCVVCLLAAALVGAALPPLAASAQRGKGSAQPEVPQVSMTCPMHPDVVESTPGNCPICRMSLVPVRLEAIWTCPVHAVVHEQEAGACPICRRPLIQMTVALTFTCNDHPEIDQLNRGTCPDGKPMVAKRTLRPHGNHNPQHGGQFFMAPDNTHHLEGAYPRARLFRLYLYDDYARPLPKDQVTRVKARVVTKETFDAATRVTKEIAAYPLALTRNGSYLEGRIDDSALPAEMTAKVRFKDDGPEYRFDFTFSGLSKDPAVSPAATVTRGNAAVRPSASPPASTPASSSGSTSAPPAPVAPAPIPDTTEGILKQLNAGNEQIRELVQRGDFGAVWVPAFQTRDLAIALEARLDQLAPAKRQSAEPAITRLVRSAWLLDAFGDLGNRQQIVDAYSIFAAAVAEVASAFSGTP